jgi:tRNA threonylcarbamoyladenosine biosynthesis protein TsaB
MILAIDTATQYAGLALYNQDGIFAEEVWHAGRNHTIELMPRIVRILKLANLTVPDLTALAVSLGPGSFTGLRIGLAAAKGMALPHKLPIIGVPTLEITAYPLRNRGLPVWAIARAGRGRILAVCYAQVDAQWQPLDDPQLTNFQALASQINETADRALSSNLYLTHVKTLASPINTVALCTGEIDRQSAQVLERGSGQKARVVSSASRLRRAGYLAEIAAARLEAGHQDDPDTLAPIYPSPL